MATADGVILEKGLTKGTNWWGAFVIGLAGTILVTGIAPYVVQGTGALGIVLIGIETIIGCFLCLCLAELGTMWPNRTGGIPGYAMESFRPLVGDTAARHIGGTSGWAYWLGWFPVAPINVILTASYLAVLFKFSPGHLISPVGSTWGSPIGVTVMLICFALLLAIFIPAYLGIRLGAAFATVLGVLSMLPITVMIFLPFFKPSVIHWGNVAGFHAPPGVHVSLTFLAAWTFPILWNVIAMEAAACYVGECRGGARDAKIALTAEGIFGVFIYIMTPLMFVAVLGLLLSSSDPRTEYLAYTAHIFGKGSWENWFVGVPLILALALSVLNAIMGVGRSLYQAAEDGQLPRWFEKKNRHGVPSNAMAFNVVCAAILVLLGSPLRIYIISNGGYLLACAGTFAGYFIYRHMRPDEHRPFRLPTWCKWLALAAFIFWMAIYFFGGWNSPKVVVGPGQGPGLYLLGLLIVALYAPLYWWRAWQDRRLARAGRLKLATADGQVGAVSIADPVGATDSPLGNGAAPPTSPSPFTDGDAPDPVSGAEPSGEPPVVR
jgi:amino acid transporter